MSKTVVIFAGTVEGRTLSEYLSGRGVQVTACVATEYGGTLLAKGGFLSVHTGRMDREEMERFIREEQPFVVVDATHPYAAEVSKNVSWACGRADVEYIRLIRDMGTYEPDAAITVSSVKAAAEYLKESEGNILAATGSKELSEYTAIPGYEKRVFARVLSTAEAVSACEKLGFRGKNLICMQGPFSEELNTAMLRQFDCRYLVTKETGKEGGFEEKLRAARRAGAQVVLVGRPPEQEGYSYGEVKRILDESLKLQEAENVRALPGEREAGKSEAEQPKAEREARESKAEQVKRIVTLVGIGVGQSRGMTGEALSAIEEAELLIGAGRMLKAAHDAQKPCYEAYDAGKIAAYLKEHGEYKRAAVLLSGDIGFYSGAKRLYAALEEIGCEVRSANGISSAVYFCGKLRLSWEDVHFQSSHGRKANLTAAVRMYEKTFTLLGSGDGVRELCGELLEYGLSHVRVHIGERLGYEDERISSGLPAEMMDRTYDNLCVALIENPSACPGIRSCIGDGEFVRGDAPMTKSEIRCLSVAKLGLLRDSVVYDVGAGTGSVSIEMAYEAADGMVYAIERNEEACALVEKNKRKFGASNVEVICGRAPEALEALPVPTHAFIGGSAGELKEIIRCLLGKNPSIRMVINTVTLETIGEVTECLKELPLIEEEILSVSAARAKPLGKYHLMMGQNPVYIITCRGAADL